MTSVPGSFRELACPNCGASFQPDPTLAKTITCAHCGTVFERPVDPATISVTITDSDGVAIGDLPSESGRSVISATITGSSGVAIGKGSTAVVMGNVNTAGGDFISGDKVVYARSTAPTFQDDAATGQESSQPASRRRMLVLIAIIILAGILVCLVLNLSNGI